jgi:hypothetical protein
VKSVRALTSFESSRCPYELDTPALLKAQLKEYRELARELMR